MTALAKEIGIKNLDSPELADELLRQELQKLREAPIDALKAKLKKFSSITSPQKKKVSINQDDPFANIFVSEVDYLKGKQRFMEHDRKVKQRQQRTLERFSLSPNKQYTQVKSDHANSSDDDEDSKQPPKPPTYYWRDEKYWSLPENVRKAIDVAKLRNKHTDFYYKLSLLNDKI